MLKFTRKYFRMECSICLVHRFSYIVMILRLKQTIIPNAANTAIVSLQDIQLIL